MTGDTHIVSYEALSGASKGFNGECFAFLHLGLVAPFDNRHALTSMDGKWVNAVAVKVTNAFDRQHLTTNLYFIAFHYLLDCGPDIAHSNIDPCFLCGGQRHASRYRGIHSHTLTPAFVAFLTAASRLS